MFLAINNFGNDITLGEALVVLAGFALFLALLAYIADTVGSDK